MKRLRAFVLPAAGLVLAAGCTSAPQSPVPNPILPRQVSGDIGVGWCTPAGPLLPGSAVDSCGRRVLDLVTSRLTRFDDNGAPELDAAASIETADQRNYTVRLAAGRKFSDGTPVRARNFVSAWNWAAYGPNGQPLAYQFDFLEGADRLICAAGQDCAKDGRPTTIAGLRVIDDSTFTITTRRPITDLKARLAETTFAPLPDSFFAEPDQTRFTKQPVGAGPFRVVYPIFGPEVVLESVEGYAGKNPPKIRRVTLRAYEATGRNADGSAQYADVVGGQLDFTNTVPTDQLYENLWQTELKDRSMVAPVRGVEVLSFVKTDQQLAQKLELRQAISQAIDRSALTRQVFNRTRKPAEGWVTVPGYESDACGQWCRIDKAAARHRYDQAGGYSGKFWITVAGDLGHKQWADAMCNQLKNTLGLDCQVKVLPNQKAVAEQLAAGELTGAVWQAPPGSGRTGTDQLSRYANTSVYNVTGWHDDRFEAALDEASSAPTTELANQALARAEAELTADLPSVPLWTAELPVGWSSRLKDVRVTGSGDLDVTRVSVN